MKKLIVLFALATGLAVLSPGTAQAGHNHYQSRSYAHSCGSCGGHIYRQRVIVGHSECGDPIYRWRTAAHRCQHRHSSHHRSGHGHSGHGHYSGHFSAPGIHVDFGGHRRH